MPRGRVRAFCIFKFFFFGASPLGTYFAWEARKAVWVRDFGLEKSLGQPSAKNFQKRSNLKKIGNIPGATERQKFSKAIKFEKKRTRARSEKLPEPDRSLLGALSLWVRNFAWEARKAFWVRAFGSETPLGQPSAKNLQM